MLPIRLRCNYAVTSTVVLPTTAVMAMSEPTREYECCQLKETHSTWSGGMKECFNQGQRIIHVRTVAQNNAILEQVTSSFSKYWIGIYQSDKGTHLVSESMTIIGMILRQANTSEKALPTLYILTSVAQHVTCPPQGKDTLKTVLVAPGVALN